jgi:hypothetical protein
MWRRGIIPVIFGCQSKILRATRTRALLGGRRPAGFGSDIAPRAAERRRTAVIRWAATSPSRVRRRGTQTSRSRPTRAPGAALRNAPGGSRACVGGRERRGLLTAPGLSSNGGRWPSASHRATCASSTSMSTSDACATSPPGRDVVHDPIVRTCRSRHAPGAATELDAARSPC